MSTLVISNNYYYIQGLGGLAATCYYINECGTVIDDASICLHLEQINNKYLAKENISCVIINVSSQYCCYKLYDFFRDKEVKVVLDIGVSFENSHLRISSKLMICSSKIQLEKLSGLLVNKVTERFIPTLTKKELWTASLISTGHCYQKTSKIMGLNPKVVSLHKNKILHKLGIKRQNKFVSVNIFKYLIQGGEGG